MITAPGVYDVPELDYHADRVLAPELGRSLSVSGAKLLLPPSCPAVFEHVRRTGPLTKDAFDFGHAAHAKVLGVGQPIVSIDATDWRTKAAKEAKAAAHAEGNVPMLAADVAIVEAMHAALLAHPIARAIFSEGAAETSLYALDEQTGVTLRGRTDWIRDNAIIDYKTTTAGGANPSRFSKSAADFGYCMQDPWYTDLAAALGLGDLPFLFVVQEKVAPYLVSVVQLDDEARDIGRRLNRQAIDLYAQCESDDEWPGYTTDIETVSLPRWFANTH